VTHFTFVRSRPATGIVVVIGVVVDEAIAVVATGAALVLGRPSELHAPISTTMTTVTQRTGLIESSVPGVNNSHHGRTPSEGTFPSARVRE
jgi:hypothetical protein